MDEFKVMREHFGDKAYVEGDRRMADKADVAHLVAAGVLAPVSAEEIAARKVDEAEAARIAAEEQARIDAAMEAERKAHEAEAARIAAETVKKASDKK